MYQSIVYENQRCTVTQVTSEMVFMDCPGEKVSRLRKDEFVKQYRLIRP